MKFAIEFVKTALLLCAWPVMVVESWGAVPKGERGEFAATLNGIAIVFAALIWVTYYVDSLWLKVPLGFVTLVGYLCCGLFMALALAVVGTPNYEDY